MNRRSWTIVGAVVAVLGAGVYALGLVEGDADVRQVGDVVADPAAHRGGTYTLVGMPQPAEVPVQAPGGGVEMVPNAAHRNETRHVAAWHLDGRLVHSVHALRRDADGTWHATNTSRFAGTDQEAAPTTTATFRLPGTAFPIEGFAAQGAAKAWLWATYEGPLRDPLQPKPSQFEGRLLTHLPDGTPLPDGVLVFHVEAYTVGCSSKFLPPEAEGHATEAPAPDALDDARGDAAAGSSAPPPTS